MSKKCIICGKKTIAGRTISRKGLAKKKGGTGKKTTRVNKRKFLPNLQKLRTLVNGRVMSVYACTKCIKAGKVQKYKR